MLVKRGYGIDRRAVRELARGDHDGLRELDPGFPDAFGGGPEILSNENVSRHLPLVRSLFVDDSATVASFLHGFDHFVHLRFSKRLDFRNGCFAPY